MTTVATVAIVGAGPRGTSLLERLAANCAGPLRVEVIEPHQPGGGQIWAGDQPEHLLMNTFAGDATIFTDDTVRCEGPVRPGPTLYEWASASLLAADASPTLQAEARSLEPWSHPSRALQGSYLAWAFAEAQRANPLLTVTVHRGRALSCATEPDGRQLITLDTGATLTADVVVLVTGHAPVRLTAAERHSRRFAAARGGFFAPPANPLHLDLSGVPAGRILFCRGLGMNFFDYMSLLTIGRGGEFREGFGTSPLHYRRSGAEPVLWVGSRRGVPYRAKGRYGGEPPRYPPRYFDEEVLRRLSAAPGPVDFRTEIWPLVAKDGAFAYYDVLAREDPDAFAEDPARLVAALDALPWDSPELLARLASVVPDPAHRLDLAALDQPLRGLRFADSDALQSWMLGYLEADLAQADLGLRSPIKVASYVLGAGRAKLRTLGRYSGIAGTSQARDVAWFKGFAGSLASGPPARRIAELIALLEADLLRFVGPDLAIDTDDARGFVARSPAVPGFSVAADALLEARLPGTDLTHTAEPLLRSLLAASEIRPYVVADPDSAGWVSGAVEITDAPYRLVRADGTADPHRFALGIPVEGVHWGTQLGAIARSNSWFLRETDAVARAVLQRCSVLQRRSGASSLSGCPRPES